MGKSFGDEDFTLVNKNGEQVLFLTSDPSVNKFTFTFINKTEEDITFTGGPPIPPNGTSGGSSFQFNFESMLTESVVAGMNITLPEGWDKLYTKPNHITGTASTWSLAPKDTIVIKAGQPVEFNFQNITTTNNLPGYFEIFWASVPGYNDPLFPLTKHLAVVKPPDPKLKDLPLSAFYSDPIHPMQGQSLQSSCTVANALSNFENNDPLPVFISWDSGALVQNGVTLNLQNKGKNPINNNPTQLRAAALPSNYIPACCFSKATMAFYNMAPVASTLTAGGQSQIFISFLFGSYDYELTSQQIADNNLSIGISSTNWTPMQHGSGTSYWQFNANGALLWKGNETISLPLTKIITELTAKPTSFTHVFIQVNNVTGYNDLAVYLPIEKLLSKPQAVCIVPDPTSITIGENVKLSWVSSLASRVTIDYRDRNGNVITLDSAKGDIGLNGSQFALLTPPTAETTTFTFSAYGNSQTPSVLTRQVHVTQKQASIHSFVASPQLANVTAPAPIKFIWTVDQAQKVELITPSGPVDVTGKTEYTFPALLTTTRFTLNAYSYGTQFPIPTKSVLEVYAYKPGGTIPVGSSAKGMQSWPTCRVSNRNNSVFILNVGANRVIQANIYDNSIVMTYAGSAMALSLDETKLFTYTTDPNNFGVSIVDIASKAVSAPIDLGPVYEMITSPKLAKLYCAATQNLNTVTVLDVNAANNSLSNPVPVTVGTSPRAFAFNKDGSKLYVANYNSGSVSVINVSDNTVKSIDIQASEPNRFAFSSVSNLLFVAAEGGNTVVVIDTTTDTLKTSITVGDRPSNILLSPDQSLAYVANFGANTISVIDVAKLSAAPPLTVGNGPLGMVLNGDGNVFFVSNYCDKTLSVVDVNLNVVLPQTLDTGTTASFPFDLCAYTDNSDYTRIFVAKENWNQRRACANPETNAALDVAVYSIQKPGRLLNEPGITLDRGTIEAR